MQPKMRLAEWVVFWAIIAVAVVGFGMSVRMAAGDTLDFPDAAYFKNYTASGTYGTCDVDSSTYATPTDGAPFVVRQCTTGATTSAEAFTVPFLWPPSASVSAGTCTCTINAINPANNTQTTTWALAVACCEFGTASCVAKTFGTEQTATLTNKATANATIIQATMSSAAPNAYTNLAVGTPCDLRVARKNSGSPTYADASAVAVKALHCTCQ